jgi:hypothetical protein
MREISEGVPAPSSCWFRILRTIFGGNGGENVLSPFDDPFIGVGAYFDEFKDMHKIRY